MIELVFLVCWTSLFLVTAFFIWKRITEHVKVYLILILHLIFLGGLFYFYPIILSLIGKS